MTSFLIRKFIKDSENIHSEKVREHYGTLSSLVGIVCNVFLFALKFTMGILSNSIAITSDAFNNLSDSASCIITLFGYKMAAKPADRDHPFGHGRIEYLTSLIIAAIIMVVGFELLKTSFDKVLHPETITFSWIVLVSLLFSIILKWWISGFNRKIGKKINNQAMLATAADSSNDMIATSATVISLIASLFLPFPLDGLMGILVSGFVFYAGYGIIKETLNLLIGEAADPSVVLKIHELMLSRPEILGIHDMVIHNYGPGKMIGSVHAEVNSERAMLELHDAIDDIEKEINEKLRISMVIHMDPIDMYDEQILEKRTMIIKIVQEIYQGLTIHDFRIMGEHGQENLVFDVLVPFDCKLKDSEIQSSIDCKLVQLQERYKTVITFDRSYI